MTTTSTDGYQYQNEKMFQQKIVKHLRKNNWITFEQVQSYNQENRADIITTRKDVDVFIGIELKPDTKSKTLTNALKQIINYQKAVFPYQPSIWSIITPKQMNWLQQRFFWRFGVGTGFHNTPRKHIQYINADVKDTIWLDIDNPYHKNTPENIHRLCEKIQKEYVI